MDQVLQHVNLLGELLQNKKSKMETELDSI